ncbi:MAG: substrate-binding domain-containing protein [Lachnospiraceae bacterium]|nr:substrate-binding domain-containing protein [Lachnospiraceae bacterium]MDD7078166.1 substrate-binding domain-containing protein [Lachnospiraceae bacterium]MDY3730027.1 substrate-binding domain-containing protein [Candidatus Choladocola sp.]
MNKKLISSLLVATMVMAPMAVANAEEAAGPYTIGYAPATLNNAFWLAVKDGVEKAIEEKGIEVELVDIDANGDQSIMNDGIANLLSSGVDAILCAPADSNAVGSALEQCQQAGVPVINFDTPVPDAEMVETIIASDNYNAGYVVGKDAAEKMDDGAKILVLHSPRASACVQRYEGFVAALEESGKEYTEVNNLDGQGATEVSMTLTADALVADPDLQVIFAVNDPSAMGAINAIQQATVELTNDIMVYGVDGNPDAKKLIESGEMEGTGSQSPETLGYDSMMAAFDVLEGKEIDKEIVVDTFLITAENVAEFGTDGWQ